MLQNKQGLKKAKTYTLIKNNTPFIKSSVKLDSFLNFSKLSNDSSFSLNAEYKIEKEEIKKKKKNKNLSIPKNKKQNINKNYRKHHKHLSYINDFNKTLAKNKTALSQYILLNNSSQNDFYFQNIKLLGNSRYKYTSPMMFVEDQKSNMQDNNFGLIPIPMERCKLEISHKENKEKTNKLYELQRSIVMLRRKQFNKVIDKKKHRNQYVDYNSNIFKNEADDISDYINKIIFIQKWWNNYCKRKEVENKLNIFKERIKYFVNKIFFREFKEYATIYKKPKSLKCYNDKVRLGLLYCKLMNEKIIEDNEENILDPIEVDSDNISNNKKQKNKKFLNEDENDTYLNNYKIILNNYETDDNNDEKIKNLNNDENNLFNNSEKKDKNPTEQKYNDEKFLIFSNIIKKVFLLRLINRTKINTILPIINLFKPKAIYISKIRKRVNNELLDDFKPIQRNKNNNGYYISKIIRFNDLNSKNKEKEKCENLEDNIIYNPIKELCCYTSIIRKRNYMKYIIYIQNIYRVYLNKTGKKLLKKPVNNIKFITIKRIKILNTKLKEQKKKYQYIIQLMNLFLTKNIQEYIFNILKSRKKENITKNDYYFPFYIKTLQRLINYLKNDDNHNQKIFLYFRKLFNFEKTPKKHILQLICFLSEKNKLKLINTNIFSEHTENDIINFLCDFSEFDKNIKNEIFIKERIKKIKFNNGNIFSLVKLIDTEYNNLVKGLYCFKCYNNINLCNCKKGNNNNFSKFSSKNDLNKVNDKSEDNSNLDDFDFISNDVSNEKRQINYFDYNKEENDDNILIKTKTNINDNQNEKLLDIILPEEMTKINNK